MITEKFNDLFHFVKKSKLKASDGDDEGKYPFLTSSQKITKKTDNPQFFEESIVFGNGGSANVHYLKEPFSTTSHSYVAERKVEKINIKYVYYYISGNLHILEKGFKGAGLKNISSKYIANLDIPILPIETQNKIVAVLDKASALVQHRENSIALLDELLRAQFLEMFGDPVLNPKGWEVEIFSSIGKFQSGGTPSKKNDKFWQGDFPWVSPKDMKRELIDDSIDYISEDVFEETSLRKISNFNILIVVRGMILAHSFPVAINIRPIAINQDMKAIQLNNNFNPFFTLMCLIVMKDWILKFVSTAGHGTKKLSSESIGALTITSPPIKLQNRFETIYHNIQSQKETLTESKMELENLYNSLLQRAFNGQLNFNVDAELDALLAAIDIDEEDNDIRDIATVYASRLLERLESQEFDNQTQYQQAKQVAFQMLKEGAIEQAYDIKEEAVKMKLV